jgi:hypothetical protein
MLPYINKTEGPLTDHSKNRNITDDGNLFTKLGHSTSVGLQRNQLKKRNLLTVYKSISMNKINISHSSNLNLMTSSQLTSPHEKSGLNSPNQSTFQ